jgi:hypothetical protein
MRRRVIAGTTTAGADGDTRFIVPTGDVMSLAFCVHGLPFIGDVVDEDHVSVCCHGCYDTPSNSLAQSA